MRLYILLFLFFASIVCNGQNYENSYESWPWAQFVTSGTSGGGSIFAQVKGDQLTVSFGAGFVASTLKTGALAKINTTPALPTGIISLGTLVSGYTVKIENGYIKIEATTTPPETVTGFSETFVVDLTLYPAPIPSMLLNNYVKVLTANVPITTGLASESDVAKVLLTLDFYDGLGRQVQTVNRKQSPSEKDIISHKRYDDLGRANKEFLPYTHDQNTDAYHSNAVSEQIEYYSLLYGGADGGSAVRKTSYENSPLQRTTGVYSEGESWVGAFITPRGILTNYETNVSGTAVNEEQIRIWRISENYTVSSGGYYSSSMLTVVVTRDENNNTVREYSDKLGRVVLKKVAAIKSPSLNNPEHWAHTYYIYNDFGDLAVVLPPEAVKAVETSQTN